MRVLVAMSGGVDSSVAAAVLLEEGHEVVGATMKLWGGDSDSGCCSVADVDDARRVAQQLAITHHVFNFTDDFDADVVDHYVHSHAVGATPNPCIECNRHLKFDRFLRRARQLGFDAIATGHHARIVSGAEGWELRRGHDLAKDQSYVLHMLGQEQLARVLLPIGAMTKAEVRERAAGAGLRTASKPDSQEVCFIASTSGRAGFLGPRLELHPGDVVDATGAVVGAVPAVELVTIGQRRGLGGPGGTDVRYAVAVDVPGRRVTVGAAADLLTEETAVAAVSWTSGPIPAGTPVAAQVSAHGAVRAAVWTGGGLRWAEPQRRVAPGQSVVLYHGDRVIGGGPAA